MLTITLTRNATLALAVTITRPDKPGAAVV
jgi:hypothetical protein